MSMASAACSWQGLDAAIGDDDLKPCLSRAIDPARFFADHIGGYDDLRQPVEKERPARAENSRGEADRHLVIDSDDRRPRRLCPHDPKAKDSARPAQRLEGCATDR